MKLGISTVVYIHYPLAEAAQRIADHGFKAVHLNVNYDHPDTSFSTGRIDASVAKQTAEHFLSSGTEIASLAGYVNFIDLDVSRRRVQLERFRVLLQHCRDFGTTVLATGTGTLNPLSPWAYDPGNRTEESWRAFMDAFCPFVPIAEDVGVTIAIEPFVQHVVYDIATVERLFTEVDSPAVKLVMDPSNYFSRENIDEMDSFLRELFQRLGSRTVVAHAKDVQVLGPQDGNLKPGSGGPEVGLMHPAAGSGCMNYPEYLSLLHQAKPDVRLVLEHLWESDIDRAREYISHAWPDTDPEKP